MPTQDLAIPSLFDVEGKIVLVTGGGVGIGKMIATGFARNGATVYIAARKEPQLKEAVEDIKKVATGKVQYIVANVGSKAGCDALISEFKKFETKLHVLVNNSGISWGGPYNDFPEAKGWDNIFNVNVKSIFYNSTSTDPGRVINISSTASVDPHSEMLVSEAGNGVWSYPSSKAAVNQLTSQLAVKLAPSFVTVNAILPGPYPSKMTAFGFKNSGNKIVAGQPMGRVGSPADMAGLALFLASPASAHITGQHIITDGGARLVRTARL
ncbi:rhamnolipids biosynthesis 3-oxoacyl-reductase [Mycena capillaripes]|nr:rhamnolipids biosynthesis 3-oxoacyl-reductase [Mycena capillaripes]